MESADAVLVQGRPWSGELATRVKDGVQKTAHVPLTPLAGDGGAPIAVMGTAVDVTAAVQDRRRLRQALVLIEQKSEALAHQALHDAFTGLPNRTLILNRTDQMSIRVRRHGTAVAALFVDLDHFKDITTAWAPRPETNS